MVNTKFNATVVQCEDNLKGSGLHTFFSHVFFPILDQKLHQKSWMRINCFVFSLTGQWSLSDLGCSRWKTRALVHVVRNSHVWLNIPISVPMSFNTIKIPGMVCNSKTSNDADEAKLKWLGKSRNYKWNSKGFAFAV